MKGYRVIEQTCPACKGSTFMKNPAWLKYWKDRKSAADIILADPQSMPPELIRCPHCDRTGTISQQIKNMDFSEAVEQWKDILRSGVG